MHKTTDMPTLKIISLYLSEAHGVAGVPVPELRLQPDYGVVGDSHMKERHLNAKGAVIPNRHFTAVQPTELGKIASAMGVPFIDPAWLKANVCFISPNIESLTETLIPGTRLVDTNGTAVLEIRGMTDPCLTAGQYLAAQFPHLKVDARLFPKAAYKLRGVHGITLGEVTLRLYDTLTVCLPS